MWSQWKLAGTPRSPESAVLHRLTDCPGQQILDARVARCSPWSTMHSSCAQELPGYRLQTPPSSSLQQPQPPQLSPRWAATLDPGLQATLGWLCKPWPIRSSPAQPTWPPSRQMLGGRSRTAVPVVAHGQQVHHEQHAHCPEGEAEGASSGGVLEHLWNMPLGHAACWSSVPGNVPGDVGVVHARRSAWMGTRV